MDEQGKGEPTVGDALDSLARKAARGELKPAPRYRKVHHLLRRFGEATASLDPEAAARGAMEGETSSALDWTIREIETLVPWLERYEAALKREGNVVELRKKPEERE